jgi:hypothetical protein
VESIRQKLTDFYQRTNPARVANVDSIMRSYKGREHEILDVIATSTTTRPTAARTSAAAPVEPAVTAPTPPKPPVADVNSIRQKLTNFYQQTNPARLSQIDSIMLRYEGREHEILDVIAAASPRPKQAAEKTDVQAIKQKLIDFYQHTNPARLSQVDSIMLRYKDREHEILKVMSTAPVPATVPVPAPASTAILDDLSGLTITAPTTPAIQPSGAMMPQGGGPDVFGAMAHLQPQMAMGGTMGTGGAMGVSGGMAMQPQFGSGYGTVGGQDTKRKPNKSTKLPGNS